MIQGSIVFCQNLSDNKDLNLEQSLKVFLLFALMISTPVRLDTRVSSSPVCVWLSDEEENYNCPAYAAAAHSWLSSEDSTVAHLDG